MRPLHTRLRWVSAKQPEALEAFCQGLGRRIEIKTIAWNGSEWVMWFIPGDLDSDISSRRIKLKEKK